MSSAFNRELRLTPGFDRRHPDPSKNYGIGAVRIHFILRGPDAEMTWDTSTGLYPEYTLRDHPLDGHSGWAGGICYHTPHKQFDGQAPGEEACDRFDGRPCYTDGSFLAGAELLPRFILGGTDVVWAELEAWYVERFGIPEEVAHV